MSFLPKTYHLPSEVPRKRKPPPQIRTVLIDKDPYKQIISLLENLFICDAENKQYELKVKLLTDLKLEPKNYPEIISRLSFLALS